MFNQPKQNVVLALSGLCLCALAMTATAYGLDRSVVRDLLHQWAAQAVIDVNPTVAESNGLF